MANSLLLMAIGERQLAPSAISHLPLAISYRHQLSASSAASVPGLSPVTFSAQDH